ncbi:MAG: hypothetical protein WDO69_34540 [Pseudomonadota bacterium]
MGSALLSLANQQLPPQHASRSSHCEIPVGSLVPGGLAHRYLRDALDRSLLEDPHPGTSLLCDVQFSSLPVVARFERGDESLEQRLRSAARGSLLLPLPFLWSVRVVNEAAAALDFHHRLGISSAVELMPRAIITMHGEPRLNAAILEPREKLAASGGPHRLSLASTLATCLGGADPTARLAVSRPLLPAALIQFVDGAVTRGAGSTWQSERELLTGQQHRLQGRHFAAQPPARRSERELCVHQLGLLPTLLRLEGGLAVDAFFSERCRGSRAQIEEFRAALALWRRERRLAPSSPLAGSPTFERVEMASREDSRARIAQARFEFERRDAHAALLFAIDAARATPESPDAWLTLAEIRGRDCAGSQALCLGEAICASRGDAQVLDYVLKQLGLCHQRDLAAYFRIYGDHVLGDWLEPRSRRKITSQLRH